MYFIQNYNQQYSELDLIIIIHNRYYRHARYRSGTGILGLRHRKDMVSMDCFRNDLRKVMHEEYSRQQIIAVGRIILH